MGAPGMTLATRRRRDVLVPCLLVLGLVGCTGGDAGGAHAPGDDGPLAGLDADLSEIIPPLLEAYDVPGTAIGILEGGEVWRELPFGMANLETGRAVDTGTAFNIGSISKTVAAWGVMRLVERGELDLDAPVETYLTRWHLPESEFSHDGVTIRRLLSHTAGLSLHGYPGFEPGDELPTVEESLSGATNGPGAVFVAHEPGSKWQYSGGGYTLAQLIVEEVTGRTFAEYMDAEVLGPLGMHDSSYPWDADVDRIAAQPYGSGGEPIPGPRFTAMAAASLKTTLHDFLRFARASLGTLDEPAGTGGVLSMETLQLMQTAVPPSNDYGLGYSVSETDGIQFAGHGGANDGWMAQLEVTPNNGHGLVVMTNGSNGGVIIRAVRCEWKERITGTPCENPVEIPAVVPAEQLERYVGRYQFEVDPDVILPRKEFVTLTLEGDRLMAELPVGGRYRLMPREGSEFFLSVAPVTIEFETDESGAVTAMVVQEPDEETRAVKIE